MYKKRLSRCCTANLDPYKRLRAGYERDFADSHHNIQNHAMKQFTTIHGIRKTVIRLIQNEAGTASKSVRVIITYAAVTRRRPSLTM